CIFQLAEEGARRGEEGGAALMIKQGVLDNPRPAAIFGLHVLPYLQVGKVSYKSGPVMASADKFTIHIHGKGSHGALPENGVDAVVVASECGAALQTIRSRRVGTLEPLVLSIGTIKGGLRHNIIADEVTMEGTLRTLNETIRSEVKETMRTTLAGITSAYGATFDLSFDESAAVTFNDPGLVEETVPEFERVLGKSSVTVTPATLVSEDFSYYQKVIPGFFFFLGVGNESRGFTAQLHTAEFDLDEDALVIGVKVMSNVILDYLERHAVS
ncbi:MAG TPA: amidohydrolase, partial [Blastocatellia bacterium]|nr:amidohydrolase [Blastocatellia bacterium]